MLTYLANINTTTKFLFNHVIFRFRVPHAVVTNYGSHFHDYMMVELTSKLGLHHDNSTLCEPSEQ